MGLNQRYFVGWADREIVVPAAALKVGANELVIRNTTDAFAADTWPFVMVDRVTWRFAAETTMTVSPPPVPVFYYGLTEGVETQIWPVVAYGKRLTLLQGVPLEYNFFATFPRDLPLGTKGSLAKEPTRPEREILLHVWTDVPISMTHLDGTPVTGEAANGGWEYRAPLARIVGYETPHPAQGVRVYLQGVEAQRDGQLRAWYSVDGVAYASRDLPLDTVALAPVGGREELDFGISLWGGTVPTEPAALAAYVAFLRGVGVNQVFTGDTPAANAALKAAGMTVYPRFGWFGHSYTVKEETAQWAAIGADGSPAKKDYCPLAILDQAAHPELGRYFELTRKMAALDNIDGICVDFECAPVWCWCDRCLALFREETGTADATRANTAKDGVYGDAYKDFGRRRNRDLLARVKTEMQAVNPALRYVALASANDIPDYWYDPRGARHSMRELTTFADEIFASHYCYEVPGGFKSLRPVLQTVQRDALLSGRRVDASVIAPVAQTVSEYPRYRDASMRPEMTRLLTLLTALNGGRSISFFRGDCFDGSQYVALRQATAELVALRPYIESQYDATTELTVTSGSAADLRFETGLAQNLLSRFVWRPQVQYYFDHVQLLRASDGRDRVVGLFNFADSPQVLQLRFAGLHDERYRLSEAIGGATRGEATRRELEGGDYTVTVPARDCLFLRLETVETAR